MRWSDIVFGGIGHSVLQGKTGEIDASKILFDNFNSYSWFQFLHIFTLSEPVPILFERFCPVKIFHTFSLRKNILFTLAHFLQGGKCVLVSHKKSAMPISKHCGRDYCSLEFCLPPVVVPSLFLVFLVILQAAPYILFHGI